MQVRKGTIVLSLMATLTLLFGGWFMYQKVQIEKPILTEIGQMQSAELTKLEVGKDRIHIDLKVTNPEPFPQEYQQLKRMLAERVGNKPVEIEIDNKAKALEEIWTNGVFAFTEAVDLHQYSRIPQIIGQWKEAYSLDEVLTQMDEENIYVYLKRGSEDFYAIVPRSSGNEVTAHG
jgi:hypothetical protein